MTIAIDTNVVVTWLGRPDDPGYADACKLFASEFIFIPPTVLLEAEWVLRANYRWEKNSILAAFAKLLSLPNVETEPFFQNSLEWAAGGLSLADALHLASSQDVRAFLTFDRDLIRHARSLKDAPEVRSPSPASF